MAGLDELGYMHIPIIHRKKWHSELFQTHTWSINFIACLGGLLRAVQKIRGCSRICKGFPFSTHVSSYYGYSLLVALNKQHPHVLPYVKVKKNTCKTCSRGNGQCACHCRLKWTVSAWGYCNQQWNKTVQGCPYMNFSFPSDSANEENWFRL